jgi:peptide subunit release factor 1 (eRF1)
MLDELLGRAELKDRIEELEEERRSLEARLDAESERRADAVSARQRAEERVNRLEDRIADLEGTVERLRDDAGDLAFRGRERLRGARRDAVLARLRSVEAGPEGALTAAVADDVPEAVREAFGERSALVARAAPCVAVTDDAGVVSATLSPPRPPEPFVAWDDGFRLEEAWFRPTGSYALALVRSDLFAYGEFDGEERVDFDAVESDVMNAHSKGGFSQARFERRRDEQIDDHVDRCLSVLRERDPGTLYVVGERTVLGEFAPVADLTRTSDATGEPEAALADALREFWTTRLALI